MIDDLLDNIDASCDTFLSKVSEPLGSFYEHLRYIACQCVLKPEELSTIWYDYLSFILANWHANIQIELHEAINICLSATEIDVFPHLSLIERHEFWFKLPEELYNLPKGIQQMGMIYMNTIAVFETINYWCWHDAPLSVSFNKDNLLSVLESGDIDIDWTNY